MLSISLTSEFTRNIDHPHWKPVEARYYNIFRDDDPSKAVVFRSAKCPGCGFGCSPLRSWADKHVRPIDYLFSQLDLISSEAIWDLYQLASTSFYLCEAELEEENRVARVANLEDDLILSIADSFPDAKLVKHLNDEVQQVVEALIKRYFHDIPSVTVEHSDHTMVIDRQIQRQAIKLTLLELLLVPIASNFYHLYHEITKPKTKEEHIAPTRVVQRLYHKFVSWISPTTLPDMRQFYGFEDQEQLRPLLGALEHTNLISSMHNGNFFFQLTRHRKTGLRIGEKIKAEMEAKEEEMK